MPAPRCFAALPVLAAAATLALIVLAFDVAGTPAHAQEDADAWTGDLPPAEGGFALLILMEGLAPAALADRLLTAGCNAVSVAITVEGEWVLYVQGAPAFVNEPFPDDLDDGAVFALTCGDLDRPVPLSMADAGRSVSVALNGRLQVVLPVNPHIGYEWRPDPPVDGVVLTLEGEPAISAGGGAVVAPAAVTFEVRAASPGSASLRLVYVLASAPERGPLEEWSVDVTVRDPE